MHFCLGIYPWSYRLEHHICHKCPGVYRRSIFKIRPNILIGLQKLRLRPKDRSQSQSRLFIYLNFLRQFSWFYPKVRFVVEFQGWWVLKSKIFWPRIKIFKGNFSKNQSMNYGSSKSAKMVPSKSIFNDINQLNLLKRNLGLGQIYWPKD